LGNRSNQEEAFNFHTIEDILKENGRKKREIQRLEDHVDTLIEGNTNEINNLRALMERLSTRIGNSENTAGELQTTVARLSKRGAQCGYRYQWTSGDSTITYESSGAMVKTGSGSLDENTGIWTAEDSGLYQVTWSLRNVVNSGQENHIFLYKNRAGLAESRHKSNYLNSDGRIGDHGGRSMLLQLNENDRLLLRTGRFDGGAIHIQFCVNLLSVD